MIKHLVWACCLNLLLEIPLAASLSVGGAPSVAFTSRAHFGKSRCDPINTSFGRYRILDGEKTRHKCSSFLASTATPLDDETTPDQQSSSVVDTITNENGNTSSTTQPIPNTSPPSKSKNNTGSTAIILNMNARSVTPQLISIASKIVGEEHVFVTKTIEDATLAARTVVRRGCGMGDSEFELTNNEEEVREDLQPYSLVIPVGGDGTLSGWINVMCEEMLLFNKLENEVKEKKNETTTYMSVAEALKELPLVGYIPMGTGNGLGYVIGCKPDPNKSDNGEEKVTTVKSRLSRMLAMPKRRKLERAHQVMRRLKDVGDATQEAEMQQQLHGDDILSISDKCSIVEMPLMEVTHPSDLAVELGLPDEKGDLCFFAGAGFDSLMLHDFQQIKAWSKSSRRTMTPSFVKDALSSVVGYCVALVTKTLPQTLRHGTHKIHVEVRTKDEDTLWVDHRRGDFSELAVRPKKKQVNGSGSFNNNSTSSSKQHLIFSGTTGIIAASTTPYYGGGMRLFPYARLIPDQLQLRLGRISPLTGFFNVFKIFEGSYREKSDRSFGCLDFIGKEFEVEVTSGRYEEYVRKQDEKKKRRFRWRRGENKDADDHQKQKDSMSEKKVAKGFPFQHSGESMGCKERFRLRVVQQPVKFVSFLEPRVVVDE